MQLYINPDNDGNFLPKCIFHTIVDMSRIVINNYPTITLQSTLILAGSSQVACARYCNVLDHALCFRLPGSHVFKYIGVTNVIIVWLSLNLRRNNVMTWENDMETAKIAVECFFSLRQFQRNCHGQVSGKFQVCVPALKNANYSNTQAYINYDIGSTLLQIA